ncbi:Plasma membrane t-SNARE, secretory vesicle fusion [Thoreauomyces humboldtii]|nr:Plasma membrane t-SNARE, secretory vesicle fusion [Thoreauomyces humboldtii]
MSSRDRTADLGTGRYPASRSGGGGYNSSRSTPYTGSTMASAGGGGGGMYSSAYGTTSTNGSDYELSSRYPQPAASASGRSRYGSRDNADDDTDTSSATPTSRYAPRERNRRNRDDYVSPPSSRSPYGASRAAYDLGEDDTYASPPPARSAYGGSSRSGYDDSRKARKPPMTPAAVYPAASASNAGMSYSMADPEMAVRSTKTLGSMDEFFLEVDKTKQEIDRVKDNVETIGLLHQRALVGTSPSEQAHYTRQVDELQEETSDLIHTLRTTVKRFNTDLTLAPRAERGTREQQTAGLAKRLMEVARVYQDQQATSKQAYRTRMEREIRIARPDATPDEIDRALESGTGTAFSQQLLSSRIGSQRTTLKEVQSRHEEIVRIEESIGELFSLFEEMQNMLAVQGEHIDLVEAHVDNTHVYIEDGNKQMTQAIVHRKASRKKLWWICICMFFTIVAGLTAFYFLWGKDEIARLQHNPNPFAAAPAPSSSSVAIAAATSTAVSTAATAVSSVVT